MNKLKKVIFMLIIVIGFIAIYSNTYVVKAEDEEDFYHIEDLEEIKVNLEDVVEVPDFRVMENVSKEEAKKYYYNQLTSDIARNVYQAFDNASTNECEVELTGQTYTISENTLEKRQECFQTNIRPYVHDGIVANRLDVRDYWWFDVKISFSYNVSGNEITFNKVILTSEIEEYSNRSEFNTKLQQVSNSIKGNSTYEIVKEINKYICNNVKYKKIEDTKIDQTAYSALIDGQAVCEGQAGLFKLLCEQKGVICIIVDGYIKNTEDAVAHAWNYVYEPTNKKWYAVDVTWNNNSDTDNDSHINWYLMVGRDTVINGYKFSDRHIPGHKYWEDQTFTPASPTLTLDKYLEFETNIQYSTKEATKNNVIVTISSNIELKSLENWTLSDDKQKLTRSYTSNIKDSVTVTNIYNEKKTYQIDITNIDKTGPEATISKKINQDNGKTLVQIKTNEQIQPIEGWEFVGDSKKIIEKQFSENGVHKVTLVDLLGNKTDIEIKVDDNQYKIEYSETNPTNKDVTVTIWSKYKMNVLNEVEGWNLTEKEKETETENENEKEYVLTKTFKENSKETVNITNTQGQETTFEVNVDNIDKTVPEIKINYSNQNLTNKDVTVKIESNEKIKQLDLWNISEDELTISKDYTKNKEEVIEVSDLAGNIVKATIKIENIDKEAPQFDIKYSTQEKGAKKVEVTITCNEKIQSVDGWQLSKNEMVLTKTYTENAVEQFKIKDIIGNEKEAVVKVGNIEKDVQINKESIPAEVETSKDATVAKTILPYTGNKIIIIAVVVLIISCVIAHNKYKNYKKL